MDELRIPYPDFKMGEVIDPEQHDLNNGYIQNKINEFVTLINELTSTTPGKTGAEQMTAVPVAPFTATTIQGLFNELITRLQATTVGLSGASLVASPTLVKLAGTNVETQLKALDTMLQTAYVVSASIADLAIITSKLADSAVTNTKLANNAVTNAKIADDNISTPKLINSAVTTPKIADQNVTTPKIADLAITNPKLGLGSVGTGNIQTGAVTQDKLVDRSVGSMKIASQAVKEEHLDPTLLNKLPESMLSAKVVKLEDDVSKQGLRIHNLEFTASDHASLIQSITADIDSALSQLGTLTDNFNEHKANVVAHNYYGTSTGQNLINITVANPPTALVAGMTVRFKKDATANTTNVILVVNNLPAKNLLRSGGADIISGMLKANGVYTVVYDGANFILQGEGGEYGTAVASDVYVGKTIGTENGLVTGTNKYKAGLTFTEDEISVKYTRGQAITVSDFVTNISSFANMRIASGTNGSFFSVHNNSNNVVVTRYITSGNTFTQYASYTYPMPRNFEAIKEFYVDSSDSAYVAVQIAGTFGSMKSLIVFKVNSQCVLSWESNFIEATNHYGISFGADKIIHSFYISRPPASYIAFYDANGIHTRTINNYEYPEITSIGVCALDMYGHIYFHVSGTNELKKINGIDFSLMWTSTESLSGVEAIYINASVCAYILIGSNLMLYNLSNGSRIRAINYLTYSFTFNKNKVVIGTYNSSIGNHQLYTSDLLNPISFTTGRGQALQFQRYTFDDDNNLIFVINASSNIHKASPLIKYNLL